MNNSSLDYGYTDIHSHILYGVDDGAKNLEMSIMMLKMSYEEGVRNLFLTPHNYPDKLIDVSEIKEKFEILKNEALKIAPDFKLFLGNEILYRNSIVEDIENGKCLTLNNSKYVLVEFLPQENYKKIYNSIWELIRSGYCPIIAHIERVNCLLFDDINIDELVDMGCKLQVNTESVIGGMFDKVSRRVINLIREGKVHYIGSDCHNLTSRPSNYKKCMNKLIKKCSNLSIDKLTSCDII